MTKDQAKRAARVIGFGVGVGALGAEIATHTREVLEAALVIACVVAVFAFWDWVWE